MKVEVLKSANDNDEMNDKLSDAHKVLCANAESLMWSEPIHGWESLDEAHILQYRRHLAELIKTAAVVAVGIGMVKYPEIIIALKLLNGLMDKEKSE